MTRATLVLTSVVLTIAPLAMATTTVEYAAAGVQSSGLYGIDTFSFNNLPLGVNSNVVWQGSNGSNIGTFNSLTVMNPDLWGGAGGSKYAFAGTSSNSPTPVSTTVTFNKGASYFGFWWSAADAYNSFTLYDGNTVVASLNNAALQSALGSCSGSSVSAYCGNPNNGLDRNELFVYVSFFAKDGTQFTSANFENSAWSNFEFGNITYADDPPDTMPEPRSWALVGLGSVIAGAAWRKRRAGAPMQA